LVDTVHSLVRCSLYRVVYPWALADAVVALLVASFFLLVLLTVWNVVIWKIPSLLSVLVPMLAFAATLPILEHHLLHARFPVERAALYLLPLHGISLLYAFELLSWRMQRSWPRLAVLALAAASTVGLTWHFARGFTLRTSYTWWQDLHNDEVLALIGRDSEARRSERPVKLRAHWIVEPSLNFYRVTRHYTWLLPVTREPLTRAGADYIYAFEQDFDTLRKVGDVQLASYPDIGTALLRVEPMKQQAELRSRVAKH
jgi:hypothetical protein